MVPRRSSRPRPRSAERFSAAVAGGYEGVVVKDRPPRTPPAGGTAAWVKIKPRHTFDLVVTAAEWGTAGGRAGCPTCTSRPATPRPASWSCWARRSRA